MLWSVIQPVIVSAISTMTWIPQASVVWKGTPQATGMVIATRCVLSRNNIQTTGVDEDRYTNSLNTIDNLIADRAGMRSFILSVKIESQDLSNSADILSDRVRTLIQSESILELFRTVDIAVSAFHPTVTDDYLQGGRQISYGTTDIVMLAAENITDDALDVGGWIGEVDASGTVKDLSGNIIETITEVIT